MFGDDHARSANQWVSPKWAGTRVFHPHREVINFGDFHVLVGRYGDGRRCRISCKGRSKDHIVSRKGLAVVPSHALLELPDHPLSIGCDSFVGCRGNFCSQDWNQITVGVPGCKRFIENSRTFLIFGAGCKMRVEQSRALPP